MREKRIKLGESIENRDLIAVSNLIKDKYKFDLFSYAASSLKRRISRIIEVQGFNSPRAMMDRLSDSEEYFESWLKELTVNTTELFRDPSMWKSLKSDLKTFLEKKDTIRIWHAACSSGEEVFSMCILLEELGVLNKAKIYCTDLNEDVITQAKTGKYAKRLIPLYEENYKNSGGEFDLRNYVVNESERHFFLDTTLLRNVEFEVYNLLDRTEVREFDLILVRNVLIYFGQDSQNELVEAFYNQLVPEGLLVVGSKETISWCPISTKFEAVNSKDRIFKKGK